MTIKFVTKKNQISINIHPIMPMPNKPVNDDSIINMIENLTKDQAYERGMRLLDIPGFEFLSLGRIFSVMNNREWYKHYGYSNFQDFISEELGTCKPSIYYYLKIYESAYGSEEF